MVAIIAPKSCDPYIEILSSISSHGFALVSTNTETYNSAKSAPLVFYKRKQKIRGY